MCASGLRGRANTGLALVWCVLQTCCWGDELTTPSGRRPGAQGAAALDHRPKATAQVKPQPTQSLRAGPIPERHMTCTAQHTTCTGPARACLPHCLLRPTASQVGSRPHTRPPSRSMVQACTAHDSRALLPDRRHRCLSRRPTQRAQAAAGIAIIWTSCSKHHSTDMLHHMCNGSGNERHNNSKNYP